MTRRGLLHYDPRTVQDTPMRAMCWSCLRWELYHRTITAYLLCEDGVCDRRVEWIECGNCRTRSKAETHGA